MMRIMSVYRCDISFDDEAGNIRVDTVYIVARDPSSITPEQVMDVARRVNRATTMDNLSIDSIKEHTRAGVIW